MGRGKRISKEKMIGSRKSFISRPQLTDLVEKVLNFPTFS
jgi:hypothetical protein